LTPALALWPAGFLFCQDRRTLAGDKTVAERSRPNSCDPMAWYHVGSHRSWRAGRGACRRHAWGRGGSADHWVLPRGRHAV